MQVHEGLRILRKIFLITGIREREGRCTNEKTKVLTTLFYGIN